MLSEQTRLQIKIGLHGSALLPPEYQSFFAKWMAFNTAYDELHKGRDKSKVLQMGDRFQNHWNEIVDLARELLSLECVGGERLPGLFMLAPNSEVKAATLHLRENLGISVKTEPMGCQFVACRLEKKDVCNQVVCTRARMNEWQGREMAALLRIVYQVRCNLIHGEKRLSGEGFQANRDRELVRLSDRIIDRVLDWLIHEG